MSRAERYAQVKALRDRGLLLREIAEQVGLAVSTVHDLLQDPTGEKARDRKARNNGTCIDCGAETKNSGARTPPERCAGCRHKYELTMPVRREMSVRKRGRNTWTDDQIFAALTLAAEDGVVTVTMYEAARKRRTMPSVQIIIRRFGRWNEAARQAGLRTSSRDLKRERISVKRERISEELILDSIRECGLRYGRPPSCKEYAEWAREHGRPSAGLVRHRFNGAWLPVVDRAYGLDVAA